MTSLVRSCAPLLSILVLAGGRALAADLEGTVRAATLSTPIGGARVVLEGSSGEQSTTTDAAGVFRIAGVEESGRLRLEVTAEGFRPFTESHLRVAPGPLDIRLELTHVQESVVVASTGEVLSVLSNAPDISQTITRSELAELPSNQRSVVKYSLLDPHVRQTQGLGSDGNDSNRLSINASSYRNTAFILDGVINYDWCYANGPYQMVSATAVDDMRVISGQFAAEYGTSTTGVVSVTTRSGTDDWRGETFAFLRPSGIQARPPLTPYHVPNKRAQWGGQAGGPLVKEKTFVFLSYEGVSQQRGSFIQSPAPQFYTGDAEETYGLGRVDHAFNASQMLSLRMNAYHYENTNANDRIGGFSQTSAGRTDRSESWGGQLTYRALTSGGLLNYARVNYSAFAPDDNGPYGVHFPSVGIVRPNYSVEGFSQFNWDRAKLIDVSDTIAFSRGRHRFKFGVEAVRITVRDFLEVQYGTYTFAPGPPPPGQNPLRYAQTFGVADIEYDQTNIQVFAQDDFRISSRLSGNLGLRYEWQSDTDDLRRFAPRLGMAWDATGDGRTRVTAGAGVSYDSYYLKLTQQRQRREPHGPQISYTIPFGSPGFPTFPESLEEPPAGADAGRLNLWIPATRLLNPYGLKFSLGVERTLGSHFGVSVEGIYSRTRREYRANDMNHPAPFPRTAPGQVRSGAAADATRPLTSYDGVPVRVLTVLDNGGYSRYAALDLGIRRKYASGVRLEGHYILSSSLTNVQFFSDFNSGVPNDWDTWESAEEGPTDFHQTHRFVGSASVDLPYGLRVAAVATLASGLPVNPRTGVDNNGDTFVVDRPVGLGRNSFRGPAQASVDASLSKEFAFGERLRVEGRVEVFNALNRNNFTNVNAVYGNGADPLPTFLSPIAGITNADPARQIQFFLRFTFGR